MQPRCLLCNITYGTLDNFTVIRGTGLTSLRTVLIDGYVSLCDDSPYSEFRAAASRLSSVEMEAMYVHKSRRITFHSRISKKEEQSE